MERRKNLEFWLDIFRVLLSENENRKRIPREETMVIPCNYCDGMIRVSVEYGEKQLSVEAHCFTEDCDFPHLEGQMTWTEMRDEATKESG